ncbi:hypothetical protein F2Q68_00000322 [Brassica cretica]|uniref:Uncharacterized protein n=1 Tax=Brassica cretica TaxID=69181 RepID=A0A8S9JEA9_BRACR|nr:hypothetical protein F2Q68_00000322 [Brassica cretica]
MEVTSTTIAAVMLDTKFSSSSSFSLPESLLSALTSFFRRGMYGLGSGISLFIATNIFQGFRVVLPMRSKNSRGQQGSYPIKLFYTSNMPIILQSAQLLYRKFSGNFFVNLLGQWKESEYSGQSIPVSGLAYLITTPAR